jgi:hypothetical protein
MGCNDLTKASVDCQPDPTAAPESTGWMLLGMTMVNAREQDGELIDGVQHGADEEDDPWPLRHVHPHHVEVWNFFAP